jgi:cation:H+ antiporter
MLLAGLAIVAGFALLLWSADRFVDGAAATAHHAGVSPLLIGMLIVGFGTSAPEMLVSAIAALDGKPDLALGNALGSNIINTGLILGLTALISPLLVQSSIVHRELPLLLFIGALAGVLLWDNSLSRVEALILLGGFVALVGWQMYTARYSSGDALEAEHLEEIQHFSMTPGQARFWLLAGLVLLVLGSRILVWGAVGVAKALGVTDLVIGLTIVAFGTSLPELAASVTAARKGEHDIAIGNILGSNMFNILAVIGIAGSIAPMSAISPEVLLRDWPAMMLFTLATLALGWGWGGRPRRIGRFGGALLLLGFMGYTLYLVESLG